MPLTPEVLQEWKELQESCARACCLPTTQVRLYACEHGQTPRGIPMLDLEERGLDVLNGFQFAAEDDALHYRRLCGRSGRRRTLMAMATMAMETDLAVNPYRL